MTTTWRCLLDSSKTVLGLVGSPNREGRTNQLVTAALRGAASAGAPTELVQMADHVVAACKDCQPWVCLTNLKCAYGDPAFDYLREKVLAAGALVLGGPVYWWDTSGMVRYFILKMFRLYARSAPLRGMPALGLAIAGGSGTGLVSGLRPLYHFFQIMQMRALEPVPATRFNFDAALGRSEELGGKLAEMSSERRPFKSLAERLVWYDSLPYLSLSLAEEIRLTADLVTASLPPGTEPELARRLARADAIWAAGGTAEALDEVWRVYGAAFKASSSG